jgi:hypothetical protein
LLRRAAEDGFEVFVTADQNIAFQPRLVPRHPWPLR